MKASEDLKKARSLAHEVFGKLSADTKEDDLMEFIRQLIADWQENLRDWTGSEMADYPGFEDAKKTLDLVNEQLNISNSFEFFRQFNEHREDWIDANEDYAKLKGFYTNQIEIWKRLRSKVNNTYKDNRSLLDRDPQSRDALKQMELILKADEPYQMIKEIDGLIKNVDEINTEILAKRREQAVLSLETRINQLKSELDSINADDDLRNEILFPFQQTKESVKKQESIQHIAYQEGEHAEDLFQNALDRIEKIRGEKSGVKEKEFRPTRTVNPAQFSTKPYIETKEDLDEYLDKLRSELEKLLEEKARIRIQ